MNKTTSEIKTAVRNIRYYADKIYKLGKEQFESDVNNSSMSTEKYDALGAIGNSSKGIDTYCDGIEANLEKIDGN
jgi:hypothetical protein